MSTPFSVIDRIRQLYNGEIEAVDNMQRRAYDDSKEAFPWQGYAHSQRDAMRHGLITGQLAQRYGAIPAKGLGLAWEVMSPSNYSHPDKPDVFMDLHNNNVGADIGARTPSYEGLRAAIEDLARQAPQREFQSLGATLDAPNDEMVFLQNTGTRNRQGLYAQPQRRLAGQ